MLDYSRSAPILNPETVDKIGIHVIGCGAVGSALALGLAKMGIQNVTLYDFDVIEEHNVSNQMFSIKDVGGLKTEVLQKLVLDNTGIRYDIVSSRVEKGTKFKGIVFLLVDSLKTRLDIFRSQMNNFQCKGVIDTRTSVWDARCYYADPNDPVHKKKYQASLANAEEIDASPDIETSCGTRADMIGTSMFTASLALMKLVRLIDILELKKDTIVNEGIYHFSNGIFIIEQSWT